MLFKLFILILSEIIDKSANDMKGPREIRAKKLIGKNQVQMKYKHQGLNYFKKSHINQKILPAFANYQAATSTDLAMLYLMY